MNFESCSIGIPGGTVTPLFNRSNVMFDLESFLKNLNFHMESLTIKLSIDGSTSNRSSRGMSSEFSPPKLPVRLLVTGNLPGHATVRIEFARHADKRVSCRVRLSQITNSKLCELLRFFDTQSWLQSDE